MFNKKAQTANDHMEKLDRLSEKIEAVLVEVQEMKEKLAGAKTVVLYRDAKGRFTKKENTIGLITITGTDMISGKKVVEAVPLVGVYGETVGQYASLGGFDEEK